MSFRLSTNHDIFKPFITQFRKALNRFVFGAPPEPIQWGHIGQQIVTDFGQAVDMYTDALDVYINTPTKANESKLMEWYDLVCAKFTVIVNSYIHKHHLVHNWHRIEAGLPEETDGRSEIPRPVDTGDCDIEYGPDGVVILRRIRYIIGKNSDKRSRHRFVIDYGVYDSNYIQHRIDKIPRVPEELPHSFPTRRRNVRFELPADAGKTLYYSIRVENEKNQSGPCPPVKSVVIPGKPISSDTPHPPAKIIERLTEKEKKDEQDEK